MDLINTNRNQKEESLSSRKKYYLIDRTAQHWNGKPRDEWGVWSFEGYMAVQDAVENWSVL